MDPQKESDFPYSQTVAGKEIAGEPMKEPRKTAVAAPRNKRWLAVLAVGVVLNLLFLRYVDRSPILYVLASWIGGATASCLQIPAGTRRTSRMVVSLTEGLLIASIGGWLTNLVALLLFAKILSGSST
jgi:hypothetical protein